MPQRGGRHQKRDGVSFRRFRRSGRRREWVTHHDVARHRGEDVVTATARKVRRVCRALEEVVVALLLLLMVILTASDIVKAALKMHNLWPVRGLGVYQLNLKPPPDSIHVKDRRLG